MPGFLLRSNDELKENFQNKNYIKIIVNNDKFEYFGIDELDIKNVSKGL